MAESKTRKFIKEEISYDTVTREYFLCSKIEDVYRHLFENAKFSVLEYVEDKYYSDTKNAIYDRWMRRCKEIANEIKLKGGMIKSEDKYLCKEMSRLFSDRDITEMVKYMYTADEGIQSDNSTHEMITVRIYEYKEPSFVVVDRCRT